MWSRPTRLENPVPAEERIAYTVWDPRTNKFFLARRKDVRYYRLRAAMPLETRVARHALQHAGNPAETAATWLHEGERAVLVASDSALAEVAPQGDAILYMAHGAAFYREIRRTSADAIREMQARADREQYLKNAKQIAIALLMYVQDYDERFPPNFGDEGVSQVLLPYLKDIRASSRSTVRSPSAIGWTVSGWETFKMLYRRRRATWSCPTGAW
jgi:hypothetical protein